MICINLIHYLRPNLSLIKFSKVFGPHKHVFEFLHTDEAILILIKDFKAHVQVLFRQQFLFVDCSADKFAIVDLAVVVCVQLLN